LQNIFLLGVPFTNYMQLRGWVQVGRVGPTLAGVKGGIGVSLSLVVGKGSRECAVC